MVLFRADGNQKVGAGHIMRCLSLADALRDRGARPVFILAGPDMRPLIRQRGYECQVLGSQYGHMEKELPVFLPLLEREAPDCVILDSYFVTPDYMRTVKAKAPLIYMDDLNAFDYPADIVVNYNLYGKAMAYPPNKAYLLGPQYAPLRKQFQGLAPRVTKRSVEHILFSTGGADPYHVALRCLKYLREHPPVQDITFHFVLGAMNQNIGEIKEMASGMSCVVLHQQVSDMCTLMLQCDAAVSAAGTTLYELCACGVPSITYILADNQADGAAAFEAAGLMPCAGDIRKGLAVAEAVFSKLERLSQDWEGRGRIRESMRALVDGGGAGRLADFVIGAVKNGSNGAGGPTDL